MDIKICGVTSRDEITLLEQEGAGYVGLWTGISGHRYNLSDSAFGSLATFCSKVKPVAVCVRRPISEIVALARATGIGHVQLHGFNLPRDIRPLKDAGLTVIKTLHLDRNGGCPEARFLDHYNAAGCDIFLLDSYEGPDEIGSTGRSLPVQVVEDWIARLGGQRIWLAGGLTPDRVSNLSENERIEAADIDSGARYLGLISRKAIRLLVTASRPISAYHQEIA